MYINKLFYTLKPFIPRRFQIFLRRQVVAYKRKKYHHIWPIDSDSGGPPEGWQGWPNEKKFALVLSHDVDTQKGHNKCHELMKIEESLGFRSSFNFVPERYIVSKSLRQDISDRGFQICVHGLKHDGKLFSSREIFERRSMRINQYIKEWGAEGFITPSMLRNSDWICEFNIKHCTSSFDTDPFEPQPEGIGSIFPLWVMNTSNGKGYVELPYTLPQDFTLFILMKEQNINIWKKKLDWIAERKGMVFLVTHPDYMNFNNKNGNEEYTIDFYIQFLEYIKDRYKDQYWHVLPKDIARFWKQNYSQC